MKSLDQIEARPPLVAGQPGVAINGSGTTNHLATDKRFFRLSPVIPLQP